MATRRREIGVGALAGALLFAALFFSEGSSDERLFWLGGAALVLAGLLGGAALLGVLPLPQLEWGGIVFVAALAGLAAWAGGSLGWSIVPDRSWAEFDRALVWAYREPRLRVLDLLGAKIADVEQGTRLV